MSAPCEIRDDRVDVEAVMAEVQARVAEKRAQGLYDDDEIRRADLLRRGHPADEDELLSWYLRALALSWEVDINDFPIPARRPVLGFFERLLKRTIWKLLRFYTYRMFSQQSEVNGLVRTALDSLNRKTDQRLAALEERLAALEGRPGKQG